MQFTHYFNVIINKKQKELITEVIEGELKTKAFLNLAYCVMSEYMQHEP